MQDVPPSHADLICELRLRAFLRLVGEANALAATDSVGGRRHLLCGLQQLASGDPTEDARLLRILSEHGEWMLRPCLLPVKEAPSLSARKEAALALLLQGRSQKEIAAALQVSPHTVHGYLRCIYRHFGVGNRAELLARFVAAPPELRGP